MIDYVFPYVNIADKEWQRSFLYHTGQSVNPNSERFRDFSFLKYIFRSIETNAPFINNVFILVHSKRQLPKWLNKKCSKLKIVEHKDFIPNTYLPTFNSNTIEAFLYNIKDLSETFIYGNDDFLFLNKSTESDFFKDNKLLFSYRGNRNIINKGFVGCCKRTWQLVANTFKPKPEDILPIGKLPWLFIKQFHGSASPRFLSDCKACHKQFEKEIEQSLTMVRDTEVNYNQYLDGYYSLVKGHAIRKEPEEIGTYFSKEDNGTHLVSDIENCKTPMVCINDTDSMTVVDYRAVITCLEKRFPNKSNFEI